MKQKLQLLISCLLINFSLSAENYILYTSSDGIVWPKNAVFVWDVGDYDYIVDADSPSMSIGDGEDVFGANIISNTYKEGQGKIVFDGEVNLIGTGAFAYCESLKSVVIPKSVNLIEDFAFVDCTNMTLVEIPNTVEEIGLGSFRNCKSLISVVIPPAVGEDAFIDCESLTKVVFTLTEDVESSEISCYAFSGCFNLKEIISMNITPPELEEEAFEEVIKSTCLLKVPTESVRDYKSANEWRDFFNIVGLTDEEIEALSIEPLEAEGCTSDGKAYSLNGLLVGNDYNGLIIKNGKKQIK